MEYRPCEMPNGCVALLNEFLGLHFADLKERLVAQQVDYAELSGRYTHRHAALQYWRLFAEMSLVGPR